MITVLKSIARRVTPTAMDIYDREDQASLLPRIARVVPNPGKEKDGTLEWATAFPELRKWIDERTVQKAFAGKIKWVGEPYEITLEFDKRDAERESALVTAASLGTSIATAFARGKFMLAYTLLRDNVLAYDGQDFFDVDHKHPDDSSYSNLLTIGRVNAAVPTVAEARDEFETAAAQLMKNTVIRNQVLRSVAVQNAITIVAKSFDVWRAYNRLNTEVKIGGDDNILRGAFELLLDKAPKAGTENHVDFIWADPNGPRPTIFVATREPDGLKFDESKVFSHNLIPFGMDGEYGPSAGFPQTAVRVKPA